MKLSEKPSTKEVKSNRSWREECEALRQRVTDLTEEAERRTQQVEAANRQIVALKQAQGEPVAYLLEHERGRLDLTFKVDETHERLGWTHKVTPLCACASATTSAIPEQLFDSFAVYQAVGEKAKARTSPENVGDVLDAVVKLIRAAAPKHGEPT